MTTATWIIGLLLMASSTLGAEKSRPMDQMHGDCGEYETPIQEELSAWDRGTTKISANDAQPLPLLKRVSLALNESEQVKFLQKPEKTFPVTGKSYAGIFTLSPGKKGNLRIAAGAKLWFDLVDKGSSKVIEAAEFEMQTGCSKIFKVVTFPVEGGRGYALQVSSSKTPQAEFIFSLQ